MELTTYLKNRHTLFLNKSVCVYTTALAPLDVDVPPARVFLPVLIGKSPL